MDNYTRTAYEALCAEEQKLLAVVARKRQMIEELAAELGETPPPFELPLPMSDGQTIVQSTPSFTGGRNIQSAQKKGRKANQDKLELE